MCYTEIQVRFELSGKNHKNASSMKVCTDTFCQQLQTNEYIHASSFKDFPSTHELYM